MNRKFNWHEQIWFTWIAILLALPAVSCNGQDFGVLQPTPKDLCKCLPIEPDIADYRHLAKHVPIPNIAAQEVSVEIILTWSQDPVIPPDAPRTGRELEVFHIASAFLQNASVNAVDCDVVMEISQIADKSSSMTTSQSTALTLAFCKNAKVSLKNLKFAPSSWRVGGITGSCDQVRMISTETSCAAILGIWDMLSETPIIGDVRLNGQTLAEVFRRRLQNTEVLPVTAHGSVKSTRIAINVNQICSSHLNLRFIDTLRCYRQLRGCMAQCWTLTELISATQFASVSSIRTE